MAEVMAKIDSISWKIENRVITIINAGIDASENLALRPLRELIQNSDDARSDRIAIRISGDSMVFSNDGLTLTMNTDGSEGGGTLNALMELDSGHKERDPDSSGHFGSGFRSSHLFSDYGHVNGKVIKDGESARVRAVSKSYTTDLENLDTWEEFEVRGDQDRPKRNVSAGSADARQGVEFTFPWRTKARNDKWDGMLWNKKRIAELASDYAEEIPKILLGCRWIREAVLVVDVGGNKSTSMWVRDFNIEEYQKTWRSPVYMKHFVSKKAIKTPLLKVSENEFTLDSEKQFLLLCHRVSKSNENIPSRANYKPYCFLIIPIAPGDELLPSYTPMALAGKRINAFGPLSFLPPHESRTKIKIDHSMKPVEVIWAGFALKTFSKHLLPRALDECLGMVDRDDMNITSLLRLLPRTRPDLWFSDSPQAHISDELAMVWHDYMSNTNDEEFIPTSSGLVRPSDSVVVSGFEEDERSTILKVLDSIGIAVMDNETAAILESLSREHPDKGGWGSKHPLEMATTVEDAISLTNLIISHIEHSGTTLSLDNLDEETARDFLKLVITEPSQVWEGSADRFEIPAIPDADGVLRPLKEEGDYYFFEAMRHMPDLMPPSRRVHPGYIGMLKDVELGEARAAELANLVDEAVRDDPSRFEKLDQDDGLWLQVSKALVDIVTKDDFRIDSVKHFRFVPCKEKGQTIVRRANHVGDKVWGVHVKPGVWKNFCRKEFIFADGPGDRDGILGLHEEIINRLSWLEIHPKLESRREEVRDRLKLHKALSSEPGANIIRSLIFAQTDSMADFGTASSLFDSDSDGNPEIDTWIGRELGDALRDEILESLLGLLSTKDKLSTGWGNQSRSKVHDIKMLKGIDGEWHRVGDLCYDLPSELSELFGKTPILEEHKELLGHQILTLPVATPGGSGLGIMERVEEENILEKLNSLDTFDNETKSNILGMMLGSPREWDLEQLGHVEWVPRTDGTTVKPPYALAPTPEIKELLGEGHPWYVDVTSDLSSDEVKSRAKEIGLLVDHQDEEMLLYALMGPEEIWDGLQGTQMIDTLTKIYAKRVKEGEDQNVFVDFKRGRLPTESGVWTDSSWVSEPSETTSLTTLFPEVNIVDRGVLGSKRSEEMAREWLVADDFSGPRLEDILGRLREEDREATIRLLWDLLVPRATDLTREQLPSDCSGLPVPIGNGKTATIGDLAFCGSKSEEIAASESISTLTILPPDYHLKEVLTEKFGALDLEAIDIDTLLGFASEAEESEHTQSSLERLWLGLALVDTRDSDLLEAHVWPSSSFGRDGVWRYQSHSAIPEGRSPKALFPESDDDTETIGRMISEGLPMFVLPREGPLMERIYSRLGADKKRKVPLLTRHSRRKASDERGSEEDWQFLRRAIENITKAAGILEIGNRVSEVRATRTSHSISSELMVRLGPGADTIFWKRDPRSFNATAIMESDTLEVRVSTARHNDRSDEELVQAISHALKPIAKQRDTLSEIIRYPEERWAEIDERISGIQPNHPRPLIKEGIYGDIRPKLHGYYGCCQICGRKTPRSRRSGDIQEGVVTLFRPSSRGSYMANLPYELGNSLYLCPVHRALHDRSLIRIVEIDDIVKDIGRDPSLRERTIAELEEGSGALEFTIETFERPDREGDERDIEYRVEWKKEHAKRFRIILAMYLQGV